MEDFQTHDQFCSNGGAGGSLQRPDLYGGLTNAEIAQLSTPALDQTIFNGQMGWAEVFAQAFAYQVYAQTLSFPSGYFITTADGLFNKGFYGCAQSIAAQYAGLTYTPTYPCTN